MKPNANRNNLNLWRQKVSQSVVASEQHGVAFEHLSVKYLRGKKPAEKICLGCKICQLGGLRP